ncbi:MAG: hypothetical protein WDO06_06105 [Actinomycetota bacterium]
MSRAFHPLVWWLWAACLAIALARASSELLAFTVILLLAYVVFKKSEDAPWARSFYWSLKIGIFIICIRVFFGVVIGTPSYGHTLITLPTIPILHG